MGVALLERDVRSSSGHLSASRSTPRMVAFPLLFIIILCIMKSHCFFPTLALSISAIQAFPASVSSTSSLQTLPDWLASEAPIALQGILNNIGSTGSRVQGASQGIIVASPSKENPNYFYTWTRDAALTIKCLVDQFLKGQDQLELLIQDYISAQAHLQAVSNPSGSLCSGGLAEPKFNVDETAFTGAWGRPQRDGPALRVTALVAYARHLIAQGNTSVVHDIIWPIVQNDLSYVTQYWNTSTFDLWEEINSSSFFTTAAQYRALIEGDALAKTLNEECAGCVSQSPLILCFLQSYWTGSYVLSNTGGGRSGKDANSLLTSIHMFDPAAGCDATTFQPCSDKALANHKVVTDSFRSVYSINHGISEDKAVAVGRYPEDVYQGGNPWYLSNFAAAEQLYDAVWQWRRQESISVTAMSLSFFKALVPSISAGTYNASTTTYNTLISAVSAYADGYMIIANEQNYTPSDGSLAEQFSRSDGTPLSAVHLTWSYAAFLTANNARSDLEPASWGASTAELPSVCSGGSANGPCATPTKTTWPGRATSTSCSTPSSIAVTFSELKTTSPGDTVYITGNISQLGNWDTTNAVALNAEGYTANDPQWSVVVSLPLDISLQYKYFAKYADGSIVWESDPNRALTIEGSCAGTETENDSWR